MTGVGGTPRTLPEKFTDNDKKIVSLERQLRRAGALDLSNRLVAGDGISLEGSGSAASPFIINATNMRRGPGGERAVTSATYWDFWQDTDGTEQLYVGNKTGGWRQYSGTVGWAATAWDNTNGTGLAGTAGRTLTNNLPTILESNEFIGITQIGGGTGFNFSGLVAITRGASNTPMTIRHMQILGTGTQALTVGWWIHR